MINYAIRFIYTFTILVFFNFFLFVIISYASENNLQIQLNSQIATKTTNVRIDELNEIKIIVPESINTGSIAAEIKFNINEINIINIIPNMESCTLWDKVPAYSEGLIKFVCAINPNLNGPLEIINFKVKLAKDFQKGTIELKNFRYTNTSGEIKSENDQIFVINSTEFLQSEASFSKELLFIFNLVIIFSLIITLYMAYRQYKIFTNGRN